MGGFVKSLWWVLFWASQHQLWVPFWEISPPHSNFPERVPPHTLPALTLGSPDGRPCAQRAVKWHWSYNYNFCRSPGAWYLSIWKFCFKCMSGSTTLLMKLVPKTWISMIIMMVVSVLAKPEIIRKIEIWNSLFRHSMFCCPLSFYYKMADYRSHFINKNPHISQNKSDRAKQRKRFQENIL